MQPLAGHASFISTRNVFELPGIVLDTRITLGVVQHGIENGDKPVKFLRRNHQRPLAVMSLNPPIQAGAFWNLVCMALEFDKFRNCIARSYRSRNFLDQAVIILSRLS